MSTMSTLIHQDVESILMTEAQLRTRTGEIAADIMRDTKELNPLFVGVLKGSFVFIADLLRAVDMPCGVEFIAVSSYGAKTKTTGQVRILKDIEQDIEGRHLIVVEDILDSGITLNYILKLMQARKPASIRLCTLLDKPERRKVPVEVDYIGFTIPDEFVVGYGLDYAEQYRNLPYIGILKPSVYSNE